MKPARARECCDLINSRWSESKSQLARVFAFRLFICINRYTEVPMWGPAYVAIR